MSIENNGPDAAYPGPDDKKSDRGEGPRADPDRTHTESTPGTEKRPDDWNPPPDGPGTGHDAPTNRDTSNDDELEFDPDSPDMSDPQVDPLHPARTSNDPVSRDSVPGKPVDEQL